MFMICGITGHWKHPIAYFLQNKILASVQTQLIKDCTGMLHSENLHVMALVFDGAYNNQSTATQLGCKMESSITQTWFPHPQIPRTKIHVIFDVCHMIKLMRNLLGDRKILFYEEKGKLHRINWQYIEALNCIQEELGFYWQMNSKTKHIEWAKHKMNV